jgi:hypothetical protein
MSPITISRNGILQLLLKINPHKANGPDNVPGKFLKLCAHEIVEVFQILYQASLDQGTVPQDWKEADIVPLFKKGERSRAENYRPISLTSLSCKLLEHVVHSNIMTHFDNFDVLDDAQHGFRKKHSCISQLIITLDDCANTLKNKEQTDAILLDFSKAFDKVDHEGLLLKLEHYGIRSSLLLWIRSFLIGRTQKVLVDGAASSPTPVMSGVPQGTVLGPLFFLVYINDISKGLSNGTKIRLFADDSLLYRTIKTPQDSEILQKDLDSLQIWEKTWKMEFHPGKCQLLKITNKIRPSIFHYKIHNQTILETNAAKYLGVVIDNKLTWKPHYSALVSKCNRTLSFIMRNLSKCPVNIKAQCYQTLVRPTLEYACPVWDPHYQNDIETLEKVQKRAARFVTGNFKLETGNSETNRKTLGWDRLEERRQQIKLTTFHRSRLKLLDVPTDHLRLNPRQSRRQDGPCFTHLSSNVNAHKFSFYPKTILLWNNLSPVLKSTQNKDVFPRGIKLYNLTSLKHTSYSYSAQPRTFYF